MKNRFELRQGKYGMYFYDIWKDCDVELKTVLTYLNWYEESRHKLSPEKNVGPDEITIHSETYWEKLNKTIEDMFQKFEVKKK